MAYTSWSTPSSIEMHMPNPNEAAKYQRFSRVGDAFGRPDPGGVGRERIDRDGRF
jgi:hypothetical protein